MQSVLRPDRLFRFGEVMDVNLPRDKETGKTKGFGFLMYEDQRSTVLAVDNLNGAKVLERTLRVDHVKNYKQPKVKGEDGEWQDREEQSLNAAPVLIAGGRRYLNHPNLRVAQRAAADDAGSESSESSGPEIDPEDPMYDYLVAKRKEEKALKKSKKPKSKRKHRDETPEERRARKERKRLRKAQGGKSAGVKGVEELLNALDRSGAGRKDAPRRSRSPRRPRSRTPPPREREDIDRRGRFHSPARRRSISQEHSPPRRSRSRTPPNGRYRSRDRHDGHGSRYDDFDSRRRRANDSSPLRKAGGHG